MRTRGNNDRPVRTMGDAMGNPGCGCVVILGCLMFLGALLWIFAYAAPLMR